MRYVCELCGWVYDERKGFPERNISPGTPFASLPKDFVCPFCGMSRELFEPE